MMANIDAQFETDEAPMKTMMICMMSKSNI